MPIVAGAVLTSALVMGALPQMAGSLVLTAGRPVQADAFRVALESSSGTASTVTVDPPDPVYDSADRLDSAKALVEPGSLRVPANRPQVDQPEPSLTAVQVAPTPGPFVAPKAANGGRGSIAAPGGVTQTLVGRASWYDNGTTAARLPRGTLIRICGPAACIERIVNDYGPGIPSRVVDLMPADFRTVCGCPISAGLTKVTVYVYG
jgi:hypothetical protein